MAESSPDISKLGLEELKALLVQALEKAARLEKANVALREEIARLKGLKGRPKLKPGGRQRRPPPRRMAAGARATAAPSG